MAARLRKALVILMLLVILIEDTRPVLGKGRWTRKQLTAKVKKLEAIVEEALTCKPCNLMEKLQTAVTKIEKDVAMLKEGGLEGASGSCRALGIADNSIIPDDNITSSTYWREYDATKGRLNGETGWCPSEKDANDYIQVDMGTVRSVCAVETQGKKTRSFTKSYKLAFSTDGVHWSTYKECMVEKEFEGNCDLDGTVKHSLRDATQARFVRFYPVSFDKWPCMRIEVFVQ